MTIAVERVSWSDCQEMLTAIRFEVFVEEQQVPVEEELDGMDESSTHFLASVDGQPIGTARLMPSGQIGRMAVLKAFRRQGIGAKLLNAAVAEALKLGTQTPFLHAQTHALEFYRAHGFESHGDIFLDAGIEHLAMTYKGGVSKVSK